MTCRERRRVGEVQVSNQFVPAGGALPREVRARVEREITFHRECSLERIRLIRVLGIVRERAIIDEEDGDRPSSGFDLAAQALGRNGTLGHMEFETTGIGNVVFPVRL